MPLGAISGDVIGSRWEGKKHPIFSRFFLFHRSCRFTDDTVLTVAVADAILNKRPYEEALLEYYGMYPHAGFGKGFKEWAASEGHEPYNSWGNGSAMRVSPIGWAFDNIADVLEEAKKSAEVTHNHPEGIKGAQVVAGAIFQLREVRGESDVKRKAHVLALAETLGYEQSEGAKNFNIRNGEFLKENRLAFSAKCEDTVPQAINAYLASDSFEDCIRRAILKGGDSDTIAAMAGSIAQAHYLEIPKPITEKVMKRMPEHFAKVICQFEEKYGVDYVGRPSCKECCC